MRARALLFAGVFEFVAAQAAANCPNGVRAVSESEKQNYVALARALRAAAAFHDNPKEMVLALGHATSAKASGGISAKPRTIRVTLTGDREPAPRIAQLFAASGVGSIAKK